MRNIHFGEKKIEKRKKSEMYGVQCAEFNLQITDYNVKSAMFRVTEYSMQEGNLLTAMCRVQCAESNA